jgi:hypothetical protein
VPAPTPRKNRLAMPLCTLGLGLLVLPVCHALLLPSALPPPFPIKVELLDKSGERKTVRTELAPHFSSSRVLHVRFALPVSLHVEPHKGVMQISKDGGGLHRGDVLRAFTSVSWRSRPVFGLIPLSVQPIRSLFVADGMPANRVFAALAANKEDTASHHVKAAAQRPWATRPPARPASARSKLWAASSLGQPRPMGRSFLAGWPQHGLACFPRSSTALRTQASDILLIVERQSMRGMGGVDGLRLGGGPGEEPDSALFPWL